MGRTALRERFQRTRARHEAALIPFFVAGYPTLRHTREALWEAYEAGASLVELGIPFSDPVADGPALAAAAQRALRNGVTPAKALQLAASLRREGYDLPIVAMTYANIAYAAGYERFARRLSDHGLDGLILPDLSLEDSADYRRILRAHDLATPMFAAPTTNPTRLRAAARAATGFLYVVAAHGTTGARAKTEPATQRLLRNARRTAPARLPVCAGFGVSSPDHVRAYVRTGIDGVIVGSALLPSLERPGDVRSLLKRLKRATLPRPRT